MTTAIVQALEPIEISGGELQRTSVMVEGQQVVVFHKQHPMLSPRFATSDDWQGFLAGSHGSPVIEVDGREWRWSHASPVAYNCHSLSIGSHVGLGPEDWLEGSAGEYTLGLNPTQIILDTFFEETLTWDGTGSFDPARLVDKEAIILFDEPSGDIVHSGTIRWFEEMPMIISKLGEHPVVLSTLQVLMNEYAGQFTHLKTYRVLSETPQR